MKAQFSCASGMAAGVAAVGRQGHLWGRERAGLLIEMQSLLVIFLFVLQWPYVYNLQVVKTLKATCCLDVDSIFVHVCEFAWGCIWTWKPNADRDFSSLLSLPGIRMWLLSGTSLNRTAPGDSLILALTCHSQTSVSLWKRAQSRDRSCFSRRRSARLDHLATRWRCSHKEVWSQLQCLAVALRKFSKAGIGRGTAFVSLASLYCRVIWIWLHILCS